MHVPAAGEHHLLHSDGAQIHETRRAAQLAAHAPARGCRQLPLLEVGAHVFVPIENSFENDELGMGIMVYVVVYFCRGVVPKCVDLQALNLGSQV